MQRQRVVERPTQQCLLLHRGPHYCRAQRGNGIVRSCVRDCHGDRLQGRVDNGQPGPPAGPNLTKIVPQWTEEQFMTFFNSGQLPGGGTVPTLTLPDGSTEPRMPWPEVRAVTTDAELKVIYTYLHSLPPVESPAK